jgi:HSP20 family protein
MAIVKRNEDYPVWPSMFNDLWKDWMDFTSRHFSSTNTTLPSVNIKEDKEGYEVELAAPGFDKSDFKIELNNDVLTISSDKKVENETKEGEQFTRKEFSYQSFSRSFTLPNTVDSEKISAKYENGILKLCIPKKEEAKPKPSKQIEIK